MHTLSLDAIPQNKLTEAACWTLIHSLWQGLVLALIAGLVLSCTKRSTPALRYGILLSLFFLFTLSTVCTFMLQWTNNTDAIAVTGQVDQYSTNGTASLHSATEGAPIQQSIHIGAWLNKHSGTVMLAWLLCFVVHCIRIFSGFQYMGRLRKSAVPVSPLWQQKLEELTISIGIRHSVRLMHSPLVKVPVMIGFARPLILLPLSLISHLPPAYIESILLHELAHIRRRDFAMNIFQTCVEAVFFFNPAFLWISSKLREEREACCDNIVVQEGADKRSYLEALIYFQDQSLKPPHYAMALHSTPNHLLNRVKRMLTQENNKLNKMEKNMLVLGLLGLSAFAFIPEASKAIVGPVQSAPKVEVAPASAATNRIASTAVVQQPAATRSVRSICFPSTLNSVIFPPTFFTR